MIAPIEVLDMSDRTARLSLVTHLEPAHPYALLLLLLQEPYLDRGSISLDLHRLAWRSGKVGMTFRAVALDKRSDLCDHRNKW